jgi:hypothetical protein
MKRKMSIGDILMFHPKLKGITQVQKPAKDAMEIFTGNGKRLPMPEPSRIQERTRML